MKEKDLYHQSWAEKMRHLPAPEVKKGWQEMRQLLDQHMPEEKQERHWLYWLLVLLFIGVCSVPAIWKNDRRSVKDGMQQAAESPIVKIEVEETDAEKPMVNRKEKANLAVQEPHNITMAHRLTNVDGQPVAAIRAEPATIRRQTAGQVKKVSHNSNKKLWRPAATKEKLRPAEHERENSKATRSVTNISGSGKDDISTPLVTDTGKSMIAVDVADNTKQLPGGPSIPDSSALNTQPGAPPVKVDSNSMQKRAQRTKPDKGFAAAVGFNQFFKVAGQERSEFNSSGQTGSWEDYLPVPQLRYHFNRNLYVMAEAQFNAPQYTREVALSKNRSDTNSFGQRMERSIFVKKLFYFNLPVSVHITPVHNLHLGVGMQFSRLKNALGLFEERQQAANRPDTLKMSRIKTIRGDSIYHLLKTHEWRFLADINYMHKRFVVGARYNHALTPFVELLPVSNVHLRQARNHSLQLYIRYTFWDQRR